MTYRALTSAVVLSLAPALHAADPSELKPGLVVTLGDINGPIVHRLDPVPALALAAGETLHPRQFAGESTGWEGYLNVVRPGTYRFSAALQGGQITVIVGGKAVVANEPDDVTATVRTIRGDEVTLAGGVQKFVAVFSRRGATGQLDATSPARLELFWSGPGFVTEPIPHQFFGHRPDQRRPGFARSVQLEHGRFLFEERACARCHQPAAGDKMAKGLADRPGPNLTDVAKRGHAGWIDAWLADPAKLRPHTAMPKLFAANETGAAERHAVVRYLVSLAGGPLADDRPPAVSASYRQSMERGKALFTLTGCAACHADPLPKTPTDEEEKEPLRPEDFVYSLGTAAPAAKYALGALGSKYRPDTLADYLRSPLKVNPAGRMPHMGLDARDATDLARYLCRVTDEAIKPAMPDGAKLKPARVADAILPAAERAAFDRLPAAKQWVSLGQKLLVSKGCVNCHAVEPGGKRLAPTAAFPPLDAVKKGAVDHGCLAPRPDPVRVPAYKLDTTERAALGAFLKEGLTGAGSPAPTYAARATLRRFNCLNCHSRDGEGGIPAELAEQMHQAEKAGGADEVRPPLLTGIGHKARTAWLKSVLTEGGRARPWVQLRMPQYGEANVGALPTALAALEGTTPDAAGHKGTLSADAIAAGRAIIGKGGLGCISCHDIAGVPNTGTRGPDLATINQRVRYDWYTRWLHQPLRMAPGTKMPQAFVDGKSTLTAVLNGDATAQADAMWAYLSLGPGLPLPDGMELPKGLVVAVKERPEILRTFLPDAGNKAVAVGYPGGVSVAFSADQCRLSYGWAGNFLDASPVWNNRGGNPAKLLGPKFWTAPPGHPWGLTTSAQHPPDFTRRATDPAFGAPLPHEPPRVYTGPMAVHFAGYDLDAAGRPTFRYTLTEGKDATLRVAETPLPLKSPLATGVARRFAVELPAGYRTWFLAAEGTGAARVARADGTVAPLATGQAITTAGNRVIAPTADDRATVLELADAPAGTEWVLAAKPGGGWLALVRLPEAKEPARTAFTLTVWGLPRNDDALLKGLAAK